MILATSHRADAQAQLGPLKANLNGNVTGGYTADSGSDGSDHGFGLGGAATLAGSYYDPNFLNFNVNPFLNQSWANSDSQSIVNSSGVLASAGIFGGSNFPGSVSYSKVIGSTGNFNVPGVANYTSHGDSDTFGVGWVEHLPSFPTVSVNLQEGSSDYSLYGASSDISSKFYGMNATINYMVAGFSLTGGYHYQDSHFSLPELLGIPAEQTKSLSNSYSFGLNHRLPFKGTFSGSVNRSDFNSEYTGGSYNGTLDNVTAGLSFNPIRYLNIGAQAQYSDNLLGNIYAPILAAGGVLPASLLQQSSHGLDIVSYQSYSIPDWHLTFSANEDHRDQTLLGLDLGSEVITGTVSYSNYFLGGYLNATLGANHSTITPSDTSKTGLMGLVNYTRRIRGWEVAASANYSQNAQTLLITYTTNSYGYSGSLSRKISKHKYWSATASGSKVSLLGEQGSGSFSQNYSTSLSLAKMTAMAGFTHASGSGILTATGVTSGSVLLPVVSPTSLILYGGTSYSAALSATPVRGLTLAVAYAHSITNTQAGSANSNNISEQLNARLQYLIRKIYFQAGYIRFTQGFSQSGVPPITVNSVYVGLMRWFNFF